MSFAAREITVCRSCGSGDLTEVLDLGSHALSDFVDDPATIERVPLVLLRCTDCTLVQLKHTVSRDRLYRNYWYHSGTQEAMVRSLNDVVCDAMNRLHLEPDDTVLDIGCNDGTLLRQYPSSIRRYGIEPSQLWMEAGRGGNRILNDYWPPKHLVINLSAKIITTIAMFYDLDDPNAFVAALKECLHPQGIWVIQMAYLPEMLRQNAFDNICHEHLEYYTLRSLHHLLGNHGLRISDWSYNAVNGGSIRVIVKHGRGAVELGDWEQTDVRRFARRVGELRTETLAWLESHRTLGYGASTKGNTLLQYYGIGPALLPAIAERNPEKWGKRTPTGIPIISEEEMREQRPAYLFALPWHFIESFQERERSLLQGGTRFVVPLPNLSVMEVSCANVSAAHT